MPDTPAWGRGRDPQAGQPCQMAIEGLEEIQLPPFFSERLTRTLGSLAHQCRWVLTGESVRQEGPVRGPEVMFDCVRMWSSIVSSM